MRLIVAFALLMLCVIGCGESRKDEMMRFARMRSARSAAEAEAQAESEAQAQADVGDAGTAEAAAELPSDSVAAQAPAPGVAVNEQAATPATVNDPPAEAQPAIVNATPTPTNAEVPAAAATTANVVPPAEATIASASPIASLPRRDELLTFSSDGKRVAFTGAKQTIGIYEVASKRLVRQVYNPTLTPFSMSFSGDYNSIAVGGLDGGLKVFPLEADSSIDIFQQGRLRRRDAAPPRQAHSSAVTATAVDGDGGVVATGDASGQIKLWTNDSEPPLELVGPAGILAIESYQQDQVLFAITADNRLVYWQLGKDQKTASEFPDAMLRAKPTVLVPGPDGKGMVVGDESGRVTLWLPEGNDLKRSSLVAHSKPIAGIGFTDNGATMITASTAGELLRWRLPIREALEIKTVELPKFTSLTSDGMTIAVPSAGKNLDLYSMQTGKPLRRHSINTGNVTSAGFSRDGQVVAVGNDLGTVAFQGVGSEPIAVSNLAAAAINKLTPSPSDLTEFAFTSDDGFVGVATFPSRGMGPFGMSLDLIAMNASGSAIVTARGPELNAVRPIDGFISNSTQLNGERISALAVDDHLAFIGSSKGSIWTWQYTQAKSEPQLLAEAHPSEIVAIGLNRFGNVWTCDKQGKNVQTPLRSTNSSWSGALGVQLAGETPNSVVSNEDGGLLAINAQGTLVATNAAGEAFHPVQSFATTPFTSIVGQDTFKVALTIDRKNLEILATEGSDTKSIASLVSLPSAAVIAEVDLAGDTLIARREDGLALGIAMNSGASANVQLTDQPISSCVISRDGRSVFAANAAGSLSFSLAGGRGRSLDFSGSVVPLAASANGQLLVVASGDRASCYEIGNAAPRLITAFSDQVVNPSAAVLLDDNQTILFGLAEGRIVSTQLNRVDEVRTIASVDARVKRIVSDGTAVVVLDTNGRLVVVDFDGAQRFDSGEVRYSTCQLVDGNVYAGNSAGSVSALPNGSQEMRTLATGLGDSILEIVGDAKSQQVIAFTADGSHCFVGTLEAEAVFVRKHSREVKPIAAAVSGANYVVVAENGSLTSYTSSNMTELAPSGSGLKKLQVSRNGQWIVGILQNGGLARWQKSNGTLTSPKRLPVVGTVSDVRPLTGSDFALLSDSVLKTFSADSEMVSKTIELAGAQAIVASSVDGSVVVSVGSEFQCIDTRIGTIDKLSQVATDVTGFLDAIADGKRRFLAVSSDGKLSEIKAASSPSSQTGFDIATLKSAYVNDGILQAIAGDALIAFREDGTQVQTMLGSGRPFSLIASNGSAGRFAASDAAGRIAMLTAVGGAPVRVQMPIQKPTGLIWSSNGVSLAAADSNRVVVMNATTGRIESQALLGNGLKGFAGWNDLGLWYLDGNGRIRSLKVPTINWAVKPSEKPTGMAWQSRGSSLFVTTTQGSVLEYDAKLGTERTRIATGKSNLRSLVAIPETDRLVMLASNSDVLLIGESRQVSQLPIKSALSFKALSHSADGRSLYIANDLGQLVRWELSDLSASPQMIPCDVAVQTLDVSTVGQLVATSAREKKIALIDGNTTQDLVAQLKGRLSDISIGKGGFAAVADGSSKIQMVSLSNGEITELSEPAANLSHLALHPAGVRVAAVGSPSSGFGSKLVIWETVDQVSTANVSLDGSPTGVAYSADGSMLAIAYTEGKIDIFDGSTAKLLESVPAVSGLQTFAFSMDGKRLLVAAKDAKAVGNPTASSGSKVSVQSLQSLGQTQAANSAIVSLRFHGGGKYLLSASMDGAISLWNRASLAAPQVVFQGMQAPIRQAKVSSDGKYILAVYEDNKNSTYIWKLSSGGNETTVAPELIVQSSVPSSCAAFTVDSQYLLIGGTDGLIRAWNLAENREIANFQGHEGAIADLAPLDEVGRFVSGGLDHSIRTWRFPSNLPAVGAEIPLGDLSDATEVHDLAPPNASLATDSEDPFDAARQALIAGSSEGEILNLIEGSDVARTETKQNLASVLALEKDAGTSADELSRQRRLLANSRRKMSVTEQSRVQSSYADGFSNLQFVANTNFKFGMDQGYRPVRILFSDRYVYAARPSAGRRFEVDEYGNKVPVDEGDNGALLSWDYRYSQLQAHAWSTEDLLVMELFAQPNANGVFAVPQMMLFRQDGSSRRFPTVENWANSNWPTADRQVLAVGTAGAHRIESDILKIFDVASLSQEVVSPLSQYRSFEGIVTAMSIANTRPYIAFCVRERAVHRLFIADTATLRVTQIAEFKHKESWIDFNSEPPVRKPEAPEGITSLQFSPDDRMLIAHGRYEQDLHKFSGWNIQWLDGGVTAERAFKDLENKEGPFFVNSGSKSIWFVQSGISSSARNVSRDNRILVQSTSGFVVLNMEAGRVEREIKFLRTQHGRPEYAISDNGRCVIMGDDNGMAYVWDTLSGERFSVTTDLQTEASFGAKNPTATAARPAHSGPIVGVALSERDPGMDYPAFAATFGEENKLKVWELYPVIGARNAKPVKQTGTVK
jgi:WD40 repeat protein